MQSEEVRRRFLEFFKKKGYAVIPSASLVPENDPSVLFTTAGMQPLVPYLLGEPHPEGNRIANIQKSVRTTDIEDVGDAAHLTFFEMLGRWHLGDLDKKEVISVTYEFLTSKSEGLGLEPSRMYATVFEGDDNAPRDDESAKIWKSLKVPVYFRSTKDNWWSAGDNGPCGPDTEVFYDVTDKGLGSLSPEEFQKADTEQKVLELWNDVFMEYEKKDGKVIGKLEKPNLDTGAGFERITAVMQGVQSVYETDLFEGLMKEAEKLSGNAENQRIIADHMKAAVFMIVEGVLPSNTERGYVLRRLIRRSVMQTKEHNISPESISSLVDAVADKYGNVYRELSESSETKKVIEEEVGRFSKTIDRGLREFEKVSGDISGKQAFDLYQTYGFPVEMTRELASGKKLSVDVEGFKEELKKHQELSRTAAAGRFKGGLGDHGEMSVKYHTATHLLLQALREVLDGNIEQKGSNITPERLRLDFSYSQKLTDEEKQKVEDIVNEKIKEALPVSYEEMSVEDAKKEGAVGVFGEKYGEKVKVYSIGDFSKEICGGPHVENTSELGHFKIKKEESVSAGVRRIKAVLE